MPTTFGRILGADQSLIFDLTMPPEVRPRRRKASHYGSCQVRFRTRFDAHPQRSHENATRRSAVVAYRDKLAAELCEPGKLREIRLNDYEEPFGYKEVGCVGANHHEYTGDEMSLAAEENGQQFERFDS